MSLALLLCAVLLAGAAWPAGDAVASAALAAKGGCAMCHAPARRSIGPSYENIAARRKSEPQAAERMIERVRVGSRGQWGRVPMAAVGPARISDADLAAVVAWILTQSP